MYIKFRDWLIMLDAIGLWVVFALWLYRWLFGWR